MRLLPLVPAIAATIAGCSGSITDPFHTTSAPAPSGLPVSFRADSSVSAPSVAAAGDSVVITDVITPPDLCEVRGASAGFDGGVLVVTIATRFQDEPCNTLAVARRIPPPSPFRAVVRSAPRGRYDVVVRERVQPEQHGSVFNEREIVRRTVTLR